MSNIILLRDLLDQKKRKEQELLFYSTKLAELEEKRNMLMKEIALTNTILTMIKKENIKSVG